jgi:glycerol-3-phosphate dehydrogenase (NAD(P)+)
MRQKTNLRNSLKRPDIAVLGDGGWGTTLAILLAKKGFRVSLWSAFQGYASHLNRKRINTKFLPGVAIPQEIQISADLKQVLQKKGLVVIAVPSPYLRQTLQRVKRAGYPREAIYLSVTKGIEKHSLKRISEVIREELGRVKLAVLSGPTIAHEVALGIPSTAVVAAKAAQIRRKLQGILISERFRVYTNSDVAGVELGGSLKNVVAIACGISDGLGFGTNTKAALLTRGLAEITRLGIAMGARPDTFNGLSGIGDLVTTCISPYSRNRFVGQEIGRGKPLSRIRARMQMVAEGVPTTKSAYKLSLRYKVEMPITKEVYLVLYKNKNPRKAVADLMRRRRKEE